MGGVIAGADQQGRKQFFFEKKNQKTFIFPPAATSGSWPDSWYITRNKSLLLLFFRKEDLTLFTCSSKLPA
jgi:hypothetical protein